MPERIHRANLYRYRAEVLRAMAQDWQSTETVVLLTKVARDYDNMADELVRKAEADGVTRP